MLAEQPELALSQFIDGGGRYTALHKAAEGGLLEIVRLLLDNGADPNGCPRRRTPLHRAASVEIARALLVHGADVNASRFEGLTPLHGLGNPELVGLLLQEGAEVNAKDDEGKTPLHCAARFSSPEVAALLLQEGAKVNAKDYDGNTPLHHAVQRHSMKGVSIRPYDQTDVVQMLLANGAYVNARDDAGKTPLFYAKSHPSVRKKRRALAFPTCGFIMARPGPCSLRARSVLLRLQDNCNAIS